ncbi:acyl-CoA carboxylase subunit epsilon [Streptomyces sp. C36]|uniref:acyl-CoA carboxylase subunit epsilon n=1 Tax=Streptomyces sp. C36 TaxID=3237122 RepID=UPI0034C67A57
MNDDLSGALDPTTVRVTRGRPDPDELAALVIGLALCSGEAEDDSPAGGAALPTPHWTTLAAFRPPACWTSPRLRNTVF